MISTALTTDEHDQNINPDFGCDLFLKVRNHVLYDCLQVVEYVTWTRANINHILLWNILIHYGSTKFLVELFEDDLQTCASPSLSLCGLLLRTARNRNFVSTVIAEGIGKAIASVAKEELGMYDACYTPIYHAQMPYVADFTNTETLRA